MSEQSVSAHNFVFGNMNMRIAILIPMIFVSLCCNANTLDELVDIIDSGFESKVSKYRKEVENRLSDVLKEYDGKKRQWTIDIDEETFFFNFQSKGNKVQGISLRTESYPVQSFGADMKSSWENLILFLRQVEGQNWRY